ncbi:hypothetical protein T492DRAFT_877348 [Pavlovales sp. CCMP2436]|nr:hypothetical protein T492DRAFT_877348 [Pavlovales sp. CCMP2436]
MEADATLPAVRRRLVRRAFNDDGDDGDQGAATPLSGPRVASSQEVLSTAQIRRRRKACEDECSDGDGGAENAERAREAKLADERQVKRRRAMEMMRLPALASEGVGVLAVCLETEPAAASPPAELISPQPLELASTDNKPAAACSQSERETERDTTRDDGCVSDGNGSSDGSGSDEDGSSTEDENSDEDECAAVQRAREAKLSEERRVKRDRAIEMMAAVAAASAQAAPASVHAAPLDDSGDAEVSGDSEDSAEPTCGICLQPVLCRGIIDVCDHRFCSKCILCWARLATNHCPYCHERFRAVTSVTESLEREVTNVPDREEPTLPLPDLIPGTALVAVVLV